MFKIYAKAALVGKTRNIFKKDIQRHSKNIHLKSWCNEKMHNRLVLDVD